MSNNKKRYVIDLEKLLEFINDELGGTNYKLGKLTPKQATLMGMFGAVQNYAHAIFVLLRHGKANAAIVLERSLVEAYINIRYILSDNSDNNVQKFIVDDARTRIKFAEEVINFMEEYPDFPPLKKGDWDDTAHWKNFIEKRKDEIQEFRDTQTEPLKELPQGLRNRAVEADKVTESLSPGKENEIVDRLEWWYLTIYGHFSDYAHLNARGTNHFFRENPNGDGYLLDVNGNPKLIDMIAVTTYGITYLFLDFFSKEYGIPSERKKKPFQKMFEEHAAQAKN